MIPSTTSPPLASPTAKPHYEKTEPIVNETDNPMVAGGTPTTNMSNESKVTKKWKPASVVWEDFPKTWNKVRVIMTHCVTCENTFSTNTATEAFKYHLPAHGYLLKETSQTFFHEKNDPGNTRVDPLDSLQQNFETRPVTWIADSKIAFPFVENVNSQKMVHWSYSHANVSFTHAVRRCLSAGKVNLWKRVYFMLHESNSKVNVAADICISFVFEGYIVVTGPGICKEW